MPTWGVAHGGQLRVLAADSSATVLVGGQERAPKSTTMPHPRTVKEHFKYCFLFL
jgi:hypothetical protein